MLLFVLPCLTLSYKGAGAMETTLSSKGQIVIPKQIRKSHGWRAGMRFTLAEEGNTLVLKPSMGRGATLTVEEVMGCAGYTGPRKSLEEMDAGIIDEARKQAASWSR
jgi:AbrB family looped-hinge helix DNA binding protein